MEVTPINRQSYMAEVANLLGLITDEETRARLIAQMEQMFDSAEDEGKLIEQIGSPTKVAVALIRYADKKRGSAASAQSVAEAVNAAPVTEMIEEAEANAEAPEAGEMPEMAFAEDEASEAEIPSPAADELLPVEDAPVPERVEGAIVDDEEPMDAVETQLFEASFEAAEVPIETVEETFDAVEEPFAVEAFAPAEEEPEDDFTDITAPVRESAPAAEEDFAPVAVELEDVTDSFAPAVDEALVQAVAAEAAEAFGEFPGESAAFTQEAAEQKEDPAMELAEELFGDAKPIPPSASGKASRPVDAPPEIEYVKVGWKAFLYFLIPGLVPGLPVFLVLFALSLVFLAIGVAAIGCAVVVFASAFIGFNVVADMLLLIGAGAALFAVAMVLFWFALWFLLQVCFGWARLMRRGGFRFSRKEVVVG